MYEKEKHIEFSDGPISYSIPHGDRRGYDIQFFDETYDGFNENGTLKGKKDVCTRTTNELSFINCIDGLGQLTDGIIAGDDYRLSENVQGIGQTGYDWIGWKRRAFLHFQFHFLTIQNITSIRLHTSNLFTRDIYLFHSILIADCLNQFNQTFVFIPNDYTNTAARFINISLTSGYGMLTKCLKITLTFNNRSKWMLISEIQFETKPIIDPIPLLTTTMDTVHYLDNGISITQYWYWLLLASGLLIILIILLIFIYIQWVKTFQQRRKLRQ
jgi:discoidin domain receptor family protein 2